MALTFYHGHGSPYSWRVWLALEHLQVPYELKLLSFAEGDTRKPEFVAINPRHQVPTIVDDGFTLWESIPILEYLDERYGVDGPARLYPGTEVERAKTRRLVAEILEYVGVEGIDVITGQYFAEGAKGDAAIVAKGCEQVAKELRYLEGELKGPFFGGATPSAVDIVLAPCLGYIHRIQFRKPESRVAEVVPAAIAAWYKRFQALPSFDKTFPQHWR